MTVIHVDMMHESQTQCSMWDLRPDFQPGNKLQMGVAVVGTTVTRNPKGVGFGVAGITVTSCWVGAVAGLTVTGTSWRVGAVTGMTVTDSS